MPSRMLRRTSVAWWFWRSCQPAKLHKLKGLQSYLVYDHTHSDEQSPNQGSNNGQMLPKVGMVVRGSLKLCVEI
jgi:hypothetical protein